ncbi:MORN repeat-containing protein [Bacillus horti]|uniref:Uncharacterized protein n=1 Tax=Caldalkalibacillus horti TaxID=77523 RepID=A0ABT9W018_9BACI|nr:hypothetical protein [Bacillus horti]MDQ0166571.1 hypothetical protein [Bacillus horti]
MIKPRHLFNTLPKRLWRKGIRRARRLISQKREPSLQQYVSVGRYYVSKKLLGILALGVLLLAVYLIINPPSFLDWRSGVQIVRELPGKTVTATGQVQYYNLDQELTYEGEMRDGLFDGHGRLYRQGVLLYEGAFSQGVKEGTGKLYAESGSLIYDGEFSQNNRHGQGKVFNEQGYLVYSGHFEHDQPSGSGSFFAEGTMIYKGEVAFGQYSGQGTSYHPNQAIEYIGEFLNGVFQGSGELYTTSGNLLYEGSFHQGQYSGPGVLYDSNGFTQYEGIFKNSLYHGEGNHFWDTGELRYQGQFSNGQYTGTGTFFDPAGTIAYEGFFQQDHFHGLGTLYNKDGLILYKGFFDQGQISLQQYIDLSHAQVIDILGEPSQVINLTESASPSTLPNLIGSSETAVAYPDTEPQPEAETNSDPQLDTSSEPITDMNDMLKFELIYDSYQLAFTVDRDTELVHATKVTAVQSWNRELLQQLATQLDELEQAEVNEKSVSDRKSSFQLPSGAILLTYTLDNTLFLFTQTTEQEGAFSHVQVKSLN